MSTYYYICPYCGAFLDPGEKCDCEKEREAQEKREAMKRQEESERSKEDAGLHKREVSQ